VRFVVPTQETNETKATDAPRTPSAEVRDVLATAYRRMERHGGDGLAAGLAFGALVSAAPLLLVTLAIVARVLDDHARARAIVDDTVDSMLGSRAVELLSGVLDDVVTWSSTATWVGLVFFLFGATRLAFLIDAAFVAIFEIEGHAPRPTKLSMIPSAIRAHLDAFVVTLVGGLLVSIALLCRAGAPMLASMVRVAPDEIVWLGVAATEVGQLAIGFGALFVAVAIGNARLPPVRMHASEVLEGALITTLLLEAGLGLLRWIAGLVDLGAAYGAAGTLIATLLVVQWSAQVFVFGAEVTAERVRRRSRRPPVPSLFTPDLQREPMTPTSLAGGS
jgi:membrane protein